MHINSSPFTPRNKHEYHSTTWTLVFHSLTSSGNWRLTGRLEHADQPYGILGPLDKSGNTPLETLTLNKDVIIFANGTDTPENRAIVEGKLPGFETWYKVHNITVDNRTIVSVERLKDAGLLNEDPSKATLPEHDLFQVNFSEGEPVQRAAFVTNWPSEQKSSVGADAGVWLYGGKLVANMSAGMITNVPGRLSLKQNQKIDAVSVWLTLCNEQVSMRLVMPTRTTRPMSLMPCGAASVL